MANLPERQNKVPEPRANKVRKLILKGWTAHAIAEKLAKGDAAKQRSIKAQINRIVAEDEVIQRAIGAAAKGELIGSMMDVTEALTRRATKGNVPAIKLAMEASGFHNPRMEHHHSGKIEIELKGVSRPVPVVDESEADGIVDADVIEE